MRAIYAVILAFVCLQPSWADTLQELNSRGMKFFREGNYAESEMAYRQALHQYKSGSVQDIPAYAATLNNLAATLQTDGKVVEARALLTEVVSLDSKIQGQDEIVTHALNNLALLEQADGQYTKAIALLQRALKRTPSPSVTKAGALHSLGAVYIDMGQYKKAREFFEAALQMHTQTGSIGGTAPTLAFLARLAIESKDESRAFILLDKALNLRREVYGSTHPLVALSLSDIGELYRDTKRFEQADATFEESLQVLQASVGADHTYAAPVLYHFGNSRQLQGRDREALELYGRAIEILQRTFGPTHARLANIYRAAALSASKLRLKNETKSYTALAQSVERSQVPYGRHTIDVSAFTNRK